MSPWIRTPIVVTVALAAVVIGAVALPLMWLRDRIMGKERANEHG